MPKVRLDIALGTSFRKKELERGRAAEKQAYIGKTDWQILMPKNIKVEAALVILGLGARVFSVFKGICALLLRNNSEIHDVFTRNFAIM